MTQEKYRRAVKPDAQGFDEVRIITKPRYKESGLSGDEWRISAEIHFYRNGQKVAESEHGFRNVETAVRHLPYEWDRQCDMGNAYYAGEDPFCDQEGCSKKWDVIYKVKREYCNQCGKGKEPIKMIGQEAVIRKFCNEHKTRGDCGLEDADTNYEEIKS